MKNETILFKFLGSNRTFTQEEVQHIIKKNPDALFIVQPVHKHDEPKYRFLERYSDELYTLDEMRGIINKDPLAALVVYQANGGAPGSQSDNPSSISSMGEMNGKTALLKFG